MYIREDYRLGPGNRLKLFLGIATPACKTLPTLSWTATLVQPNVPNNMQGGYVVSRCKCLKFLHICIDCLPILWSMAERHGKASTATSFQRDLARCLRHPCEVHCISRGEIETPRDVLSLCGDQSNILNRLIVFWDFPPIFQHYLRRVSKLMVRILYVVHTIPHRCQNLLGSYHIHNVQGIQRERKRS